MPRRKFGAFETSAKTLLRVYDSGKCDTEESVILMKGRRALLDLIGEIGKSSPGDKSGNKERARHAMQDLHPTRDYRESYSEELMKALIDICIAIRSAAESKRFDPPKLLEAHMLCKCLVDEFSGIDDDLPASATMSDNG